MPNYNTSISSNSISPPFHLLPSGEREWRLEHAHRQQRLQRRRHTVHQTGNAMPRRLQRRRLHFFRIPDVFLVCAVGLLMKTVLVCSSPQTSNVIPPVILNGPPPHVIYDPSDKVCLPCTAHGTLPMTYEWFKDGDKLEPNSNTAIQPDGNLTLNKQTDPIEGYYQCRVRNAAGVAISNITYLQTAVLEVPSRRPLVPHIVLKACQSLVLNCSHVLRSIPPATIKWSRDGDTLVPLNDRVILAENGSLVFTYLLQSDSKHNSSSFYRCGAYNPITKREIGGSYYNVTVSGMMVERSDDKPELLYKSAAVVYALEDQPFQLSCLFGGVPTPVVEWVLPNGDTVNNINRLSIKSARPSDQGNYTCRGKTLRHTTEEHFQVVVDALPNVETELREQVAMRGSTVRFQCSAVGRPYPAVSWLINGAPYNESFADNSLLLFDVQNSTSISCNVSNKYGYHMRSTYLLVVDDMIVATSSQGGRDDSSAPSNEATITTTTGNAGSDGWGDSGSQRRPSSMRGGDGFSRSSSSSSTPSNNSETGRHAVSDDKDSREQLWYIVVPVVVIVAISLLIAIIVYSRHKRRKSYSLNDHESQRGLQARNMDFETNGDSDDSGYDDVSRKTKQLKQVKRLSDMPEVEESYL